MNCYVLVSECLFWGYLFDVLWHPQVSAKSGCKLVQNCIELLSTVRMRAFALTTPGKDVNRRKDYPTME